MMAVYVAEPFCCCQPQYLVYLVLDHVEMLVNLVELRGDRCFQRH